jgi:hypothetical protein
MTLIAPEYRPDRNPEVTGCCELSRHGDERADRLSILDAPPPA